MGNKVAIRNNTKVGDFENGDYNFKKLGYGTKIDGGAGTNDYGVEGLYVDVKVTSEEILALNATPKTIVAAPGAGKLLAFKRALLFLDYNSAAYAGVASGEDWTFKYTNASGAVISTIETTGFLDQTADQVRLSYAASAAEITPVANSPIVLHQLSGEITTGDSPVYIRVFYDILPSTLSV